MFVILCEHMIQKKNLINLIIVILGMSVLYGIYLFTTNQFKYIKNTTNQHLPLNTIISSPHGVDISVRIADTDKTRQQGLSGFSILPLKQGMLFVFPQMGKYDFWMKDMNFPIDIIWLDKNGVIVDRVINLDPESYPKTFVSKDNAQYVLEIPAHTADKYGLTVGEKVLLPSHLK